MNTKKFIKYRTSYDVAGPSNFILPSEVEKVTSLKYDEETLDFLLKTLPPKEELEWYKVMDYIFIPGPPAILSMEKIVSIQPNLFCFEDEEIKEICLESSIETKWIIIKKSAWIHEIYHHILSDIYKKIGEKEKVTHEYPSPAELAWAMLIYKMSRKKLLLGGYEIFSNTGIGFDSPMSRRFPIMFEWGKEDKIIIYKLGAMSICIDGITLIHSEPLIPLPEPDLPF